MDTDDIIVVLKQASDLHAKISDARERLLRWGREIDTGETVPVPVINGVNGNCKNKDINHLSPEESVAMDARSLASIRDCLDVLEDQLYCLQMLQDQQQADIEAALSDIEETKKIFLERLRKHKGREWAVVQEALAFLGEPVKEEENVLTKYSYDQDPHNHLIKRFAWTEEKNDEQFSEIQGCPTHKIKPYIKDDQIESKGFLRSLCQTLSKSMDSAVSLTSKTALVVAGIVTLLAVSKMGKNKPRNRDTRKAITAPACPQNDQKTLFMDESSQPAYEGVLIKSSVTPS